MDSACIKYSDSDSDSNFLFLSFLRILKELINPEPGDLNHPDL